MFALHWVPPLSFCFFVLGFPSPIMSLKQFKTFLHLFLFSILCVTSSLAIQFDVSPLGQRCISEHFKKNDIVKGEYSVAHSPSKQMKFWVSSLRKRQTKWFLKSVD